jgi:hypothetical protein
MHGLTIESGFVSGKNNFGATPFINAKGAQDPLEIIVFVRLFNQKVEMDKYYLTS